MDKPMTRWPDLFALSFRAGVLKVGGFWLFAVVWTLAVFLLRGGCGQP